MKFKKSKNILLVGIIIFSLSALSDTVSAQALKKVKRAIAPITPIVHAQTLPLAEDENSAEVTDCKFDYPAEKKYEAKFLAVRKKGVVAPGELFEIKVFIKNEGNVPWFSSDSGCGGAVAFLGTENERDRQSTFYTDGLMWKSNWMKANRVVMESKRVDPGQTAIFSFWSKAPDKEGYYREYFARVIEAVTWMDGGKFKTDIKVGNTEIDQEAKKYWPYIEKSTELTTMDLSGEKKIEVSLKNQKMKLLIGDHVIRTFPVSTGKARTPTPTGTTKILNKQEVRVAGGWPHYIMPKWMGFRAGGYGIHALPSLANDRGVFWREALNHIGSPRSHGCIRLLPADAEFAYQFGEVGTTVVVHW